MARPISDEELQLKKRARRRLVGAIVLVTAVAVILPMVLDSEPRPQTQTVDIQIPSQDAGEFKPKPPAALPGADGVPTQTGRETAPDTAKDKPDPIADPTPPAASASASGTAESPPSAPERSKPITAAKAPEKPTPAKQAAAPKAPGAQSGAYVVQVAALADPAKAKQLEKRVAGVGVQTYTEVVSSASGQVTRVRAGPYASREAAEQARTRLKKAGLEGQVMAR